VGWGEGGVEVRGMRMGWVWGLGGGMGGTWVLAIFNETGMLN